jgi:hypothetical protein
MHEESSFSLDDYGQIVREGSRPHAKETGGRRRLASSCVTEESDREIFDRDDARVEARDAARPKCTGEYRA